MRILFVIGELGLGGAERQLLVLARALTRAGSEVAVAVFRRGAPLETDPAAAGLDIRLLSGPGPLGRMSSLRRLVGAWRPDVVHGYLTAGNIAVLSARFVRRRPLIVWGMRASDMQMLAYPLKWRIAARVERNLSVFADLLIANSAAGRAAAIAHGADPRRTVVIENGIDLSRFAIQREEHDRRRAVARQQWGVRDEDIVVGHIARLDPMKDHATFLAALARGAARLPQLRAVAVAVGSDDARQVLRNQADDLGLAGRLLILPAAPDVASLYPGFDLLCSSSAWGEGFSNVIAEALATGLPVAATDVGDAASIIGDAGRVVSPSDPEALALAIIDISVRRSQLADRARARVSDFAPDRLAARTTAALSAALATRDAGGYRAS